MNRLVEVEIKTKLDNRLTDPMREYIREYFGCLVNEAERVKRDNLYVIRFQTKLPPSYLLRRSRLLFDDLPGMACIVVTYQEENEFDARRFVVSNDGSYKTYTGSMQYKEEEKENE